jgi:hypothetical protein
VLSAAENPLVLEQGQLHRSGTMDFVLDFELGMLRKIFS